MSTIVNLIIKSFTIVIIVFAISSFSYGITQSSMTDYVTSPSIALSPSSGNPGIGDFGTIGLYNGRLNYAIPLLQVGGRGEADYTIALNLNRTWIFEHYFDEYSDENGNHIFTQYTIPSSGEWWDDTLRYTPGRLLPRINPGPQPYCVSHQVTYFFEASLTFVSPDGSEITLFSQDHPDGEYVQCITYSNNPNSGGTYHPISFDNVFTTVDGSGIKFIFDQTSGIYEAPSGFLYFPNGKKYRINNSEVEWIEDRNGNRTTLFYQGAGSLRRLVQVVDSVGRVTDISHGLQNSEYGLHDTISYKGFNGETQTIRVTYGQLGNALRDGETLKTQTQLFGTLQCQNGQTNCPPTDLINPTIVTSVVLPSNLHYQYKYNSYGELARVETPQGVGIEYDWGGSLEGGDERGLMPSQYPYTSTYPDLFRQVLEKRVYANGDNGSNYDFKTVIHKSSPYTGYPNIYPDLISIRKVSSFGRNNIPIGVQKQIFWGHPLEPGPKPQEGESFGSIMYPAWWRGRSKETFTYESDGVTLVSRELKQWTSETETGIARDTRIKKQIMIATEGDKATISLQEIEYDNNGNYDPNYFSHLNIKKSKAYNFKVLDINTAQTADLTTLVNLFNPSDLVSISETDYLYSAGYKERHLLGIPAETRILNPANQTEVLAKSQAVFDEQGQYYSMTNLGSTTGYVAPTGTYAHLRGNVTTNRTWFAEENRWIETHTQYDNFGHVRKVWDSSGDQSRFVETVYTSQDFYAYPTSRISPAPDPTGIHGTTESSTVSATYDFWTGLQTSVTNANGQTTTFEYDSRLRPKKLIPPAGGSITEKQYGDVPNNLFVKSKTQVDGTNWSESTVFMDNLGRVYKTQIKDFQGDVFSDIEYDDFGRTKRVSNPYRQGEQKFWSKPRYDSRSRIVESYAPAPDGQTGSSLGTVEFGISNETGLIGNYVTSTDASGRNARSFTDVFGNVVRVDEPTGNNDLGTLTAPTQPSYYYYNIKGELIKIKQGNQNQTCGTTAQCRYFLYDSLGRMIRVREPEKIPHANLATTGNPDNNQWTSGFEYDVYGNVTSVKDANGLTITNDFDKAGRIKTSSYSDNITPQVNFYYDGKGLPQTPQFAKGNVTKISNGVSEELFTSFDNHGRILTNQQITDGRTFNFEYKYDSVGNFIEQTYPSGRVVKTHLDSDGALSGVSSKTAQSPYKNYASNFDYTAIGTLKAMMLGNGRWESTVYNERTQLTQIGLGNSAIDTSLWKLNYAYGELNEIDGSVDEVKNIGSIAKQTITVPTATFVQTYKYDALNRLKVAKENAATFSGAENWKQTFDYDRYGNRTNRYQKIGSIELPIDNKTLPQVDPATNRFTTGQGYVYDFNGNLIQDADNKGFTFDGDDKQTVVRDLNISAPPQNPDANVIGKYYYDGEGKRVKKVTNLETTIFVYDAAGTLVAEYSTQTNPEPTTSYLTSDGLGSPRVVTDKNGNVISRRDFMPFGEEILAGVGARDTTNLKYSSNGIDNIRQRFTGYEKDIETDLDFAEARMYQNKHGRFTAPDPLLASASPGNPQTFNRYAYVGNNPVNITDPSGLNWCRNADGTFGWSGKINGGCKDGQEDLDGKIRDVKEGGFFDSKGNWAGPGALVKFNSNGTTEVVSPANQQKQGEIAENTGSAAQAAADPVESTGTTQLSVLPQKEITILPLCPPGESCKPSSNPPQIHTLDTSNNQPLKTVEGIKLLARTLQWIPIANVPTTIILIAIHFGEGDIESAGAETLGLVPVGKIFNKGGKFSKLFSSQATDEVAHHMPQNAYLRRMGVSRSDGPSLGMTKADHALTESFKGGGKRTMRLDDAAGRNARQRMFLDIQDVRRKFGRKYNKGMLDMIKYSKDMDLFKAKILPKSEDARFIVYR